MIQLYLRINQCLPSRHVVATELTHCLVKLAGAPIVWGYTWFKTSVGLLIEFRHLGLLSHNLRLEHRVHRIFLAYLRDAGVLLVLCAKLLIFASMLLFAILLLFIFLLNKKFFYALIQTILVVTHLFYDIGLVNIRWQTFELVSCNWMTQTCV